MERGGRNIHFSDNVIAFWFLAGDLGFQLVLLEAGVSLANESLGLGEFARLLCDAHGCRLVIGTCSCVCSSELSKRQSFGLFLAGRR